MDNYEKYTKITSITIFQQCNTMWILYLSILKNTPTNFTSFFCFFFPSKKTNQKKRNKKTKQGGVHRNELHFYNKIKKNSKTKLSKQTKQTKQTNYIIIKYVNIFIYF